MVTFYSPRVMGQAKPNAVHEQQAKLRRFYRSIGVSAVAAALDQIAREQAQEFQETPEQVVFQLEKLAA